MQAGKLRNSITIEYPAETQNDFGEMVPTWTTLFTARASIEPLSGREYLAAQQVQAEVTTKFRIRYTATAITPKMRIKFGTRLYNIVDVINVNERKREIQLMAREVV